MGEERLDRVGDDRSAADWPILFRPVGLAGALAPTGGDDDDGGLVPLLPAKCRGRRCHGRRLIAVDGRSKVDPDFALIRRYFALHKATALVREWAGERSAWFLCMNDIGKLAQPLRIGQVEIRNRVFLAPMSGVTDEPFRRRAYAHGAGLVVSEMVASGELARGRQGFDLRIRHSGLPVHMVQLAGREAAHMAEAARIAEGEGADIIDINMGCPAKKVTGGYAGSALMRDLDHALALIDAVIGAVAVPVTVKMRLGWDEGALNAPMLARRAEQAGVKMVTIHGRTRCQFYNGRADWRAIRRVTEAVSIPVVANGDVGSPEEAAAILEQSSADAVMVGRAHYGAPWTAGLIAGAAAGEVADVPDEATMADYVAAHYEDMLALYGTESGLRQARKHLGWYLDRHAPGIGQELRKEIMTGLDPKKVITGLRAAFGDVQQPVDLRSAA
jgi:nifR3 family TIM-barrel protein